MTYATFILTGSINIAVLNMAETNQQVGMGIDRQLINI